MLINLLINLIILFRYIFVFGTFCVLGFILPVQRQFCLQYIVIFFMSVCLRIGAVAKTAVIEPKGAWFNQSQVICMFVLTLPLFRAALQIIFCLLSDFVVLESSCRSRTSG